MLYSLTLLAATIWQGMPATEEAPEEREIAQSAEQLFKLYVDRSNGFDEQLADLYADEAMIKNVRRYPNGETKTISFTGKEWKRLIRRVMPLAKERGDTDKFSDVSYKDTKDGVCIKATRYSELKKYSSPIRWIVKKNEAGEWLIYIEKSESMP